MSFFLGFSFCMILDKHSLLARFELESTIFFLLDEKSWRPNACDSDPKTRAAYTYDLTALFFLDTFVLGTNSTLRK